MFPYVSVLKIALVAAYRTPPSGGSALEKAMRAETQVPTCQDMKKQADAPLRREPLIL